MSFKTVLIILFLAYIELFAGVKGGDENVPIPNASQNISAFINAVSRLLNETLKKLEYVFQRWNLILFVEQNEIIQLHAELKSVLKSIRPPNDIKFMTLAEVIRNQKTLIPSLRALNSYLEIVISNHIESDTQKQSYYMQHKIITQEIYLLAETSARILPTLKHISEHWNEVPFLVQKDLLYRLQYIEELLKAIDLQTPRRFPKRKELIENRNIIMPLMVNFRNFLNDVEVKYLQGQSVTWQAQQEGQISPRGQGLQARLGGQSGQEGQAGSSGLGGTKEHKWPTNQQQG